MSLVEHQETSAAAFKLLQHYPWPVPPGLPGSAPQWSREGFRIASGQYQSVVTYAENSSHWSEELTEVHEAEAGDGTHPIDRASRSLALDSIRRYACDNPGVVLDVGCSSGFLLQDLSRQFPGLPTIGADYISGPLVRLARKLPGIPLLQFDLRSCPLPGDSLAAIVCLNVLEHIDEDQQALEHMHRILRPGGVAHVEVPACPSCYDIYDEYLMHHRRYTMSLLTGRAQRAGFQVLSQTHLGALVFPAFYAVKQNNRRYLKLPAEQKSEMVRRMMRTTKRSLAMEIAMKLELSMGRIVRYPMGIRCVAVLQKK